MTDRKRKESPVKETEEHLKSRKVVARSEKARNRQTETEASGSKYSKINFTSTCLSAGKEGVQAEGQTEAPGQPVGDVQWVGGGACRGGAASLSNLVPRKLSLGDSELCAHAGQELKSQQGVGTQNTIYPAVIGGLYSRDSQEAVPGVKSESFGGKSNSV